MRLIHSAALTLSFMIVFSQTGAAQEMKWQRVELDGAFRSEGVCAADVNHDGKIDVIHGDAWYEAPNWTMHPIRKLGDYGDGSNGYSHSFANWAYDLNGDGWTDLICIDF